MGKSKSHEEATIESFRKDPAFAAEYLNSVLEDGDQAELMTALRYRLHADQLATKTDLAEAKIEIIKWSVGTMFAAVGLFAAISKLWH